MRSARLDATDWRILQALQADGRITNVDLARKVGISAPACLRRARALEEAGIVTGFTALLNDKALGFDVLVTSARWPNPDPDGPSYDEDVLRRWVAAFDADRVTDLLTRQKLLDLAAGCYRREQIGRAHV